MKKNSNNNSKIFLALAAVFLIVLCAAVAVTGYYSQGYKNWEKFKIAGEVEFEERESETVSTPRLMLSAGAAYTASDGERATVTKKITATVLPADAPNKLVDWSVSWCVPISEAVVTDYITVVPDSDGSLAASVIAHQGFEGASIYVTATTRVGGFTATCLVVYDGKPETLIISHNGVSYSDDDTSLMGTHLNLNAGQTYIMDIGLDNTLGAVGSTYGSEYNVQVNGSGNIRATKKTSYRGTTPTYETVSISVDEYVAQFVEASIVNGKLQVVVKKPLTAFYEVVSGNNGAIEWTYLEPHPQASPCFYIQISEPTARISNNLYFDIVASVTNVSLSTDTLTF